MLAVWRRRQGRQVVCWSGSQPAPQSTEITTPEHRSLLTPCTTRAWLRRQQPAPRNPTTATTAIHNPTFRMPGTGEQESGVVGCRCRDPQPVGSSPRFGRYDQHQHTCSAAYAWALLGSLTRSCLSMPATTSMTIPSDRPVVSSRRSKTCGLVCISTYGVSPSNWSQLS